MLYQRHCESCTQDEAIYINGSSLFEWIASFLAMTMLFVTPTFAIYDPLSVPNNKVGIHILDADEIESAAKLVNNNGQGSWGYVTVPIQVTDRNLDKWNKFMEKAKQLHIIPIIRIATSAVGPTWVEPSVDDLNNFAEFLNNLSWPLKNRYVIIFNEVNRANEFGGSISPERYTDILSQAVKIFKEKSDKFFILPAALDNAAPTSSGFINWTTYLTRMYNHNKEIFNQIDGWNSHSYPNPGFQARPFESGGNKVDGFKSDLLFLKQFTQKPLPVFITETGWSSNVLSPATIAAYFKHAFINTWSDSSIVAVTPFLLQASTAPFNQFSLLDTPAFQLIQSLAASGSPQIEPEPTPTPEVILAEVLATESSLPAVTPKKQSIFEKIYSFFLNLFSKNKFIHRIVVAEKTFSVEIVSTDTDRSLGLAKYSSLKPNQGMLFQFDKPGRYDFWMHNMQFDIDIIWIKDNRVLGISPGFAADRDTIISPPQEIDSVLEVLPSSGIKVGDNVKIVL